MYDALLDRAVRVAMVENVAEVYEQRARRAHVLWLRGITRKHDVAALQAAEVAAMWAEEAGHARRCAAAIERGLDPSW